MADRRVGLRREGVGKVLTEDEAAHMRAMESYSPGTDTRSDQASEARQFAQVQTMARSAAQEAAREFGRNVIQQLNRAVPDTLTEDVSAVTIFGQDLAPLVRASMPTIEGLVTHSPLVSLVPSLGGITSIDPVSLPTAEPQDLEKGEVAPVVVKLTASQEGEYVTFGCWTDLALQADAARERRRRACWTPLQPPPSTPSGSAPSMTPAPPQRRSARLWPTCQPSAVRCSSSPRWAPRNSPHRVTA